MSADEPTIADPARVGRRWRTTESIWLICVVQLLMVGVAGCAHGRRGGSAATIADSASVRIMVFGAPDGDPATRWTLGDNPTLRIDGTPELPLDRVTQMLRTSEGLVVASSAGTELRFYDNAGRHVRTVDGSDDERTRFGQIGTIEALAGDRLLVVDQQRQRTLIFDSRGDLLEVQRTRGLPIGSALANGHVLAAERSRGTPGSIRAGLVTATATLRLVDLQSRDAVDLITLPAASWYVPGRGASRRAVPWSGGRSYRGGVAEIVAGFRALFVDANGAVWVERERRSEPQVRRWFRFSADGSESGFIDLPPGTRVVYIGDEQVVGLWFDGDDVSARVYRLVRGRQR